MNFKQHFYLKENSIQDITQEDEYERFLIDVSYRFFKDNVLLIAGTCGIKLPHQFPQPNYPGYVSIMKGASMEFFAKLNMHDLESIQINMSVAKPGNAYSNRLTSVKKLEDAKDEEITFGSTSKIYYYRAKVQDYDVKLSKQLRSLAIYTTKKTIDKFCRDYIERIIKAQGNVQESTGISFQEAEAKYHIAPIGMDYNYSGKKTHEGIPIFIRKGMAVFRCNNPISLPDKVGKFNYNHDWGIDFKAYFTTHERGQGQVPEIKFFNFKLDDDGPYNTVGEPDTHEQFLPNSDERPYPLVGSTMLTNKDRKRLKIVAIHDTKKRIELFLKTYPSEFLLKGGPRRRNYTGDLETQQEYQHDEI